MKSKRVLWKNNSILYAEHMNKFCDLIEEGYGYIFMNTIKYGYGILKIQIDEVLLSSGVLSINYINGIFLDGSVFDYDISTYNYKLQIDLTQYSDDLFYNPKKFYISKDYDNFEESKEIMSSSEEIIPIVFESIKLKLSDNIQNSNSIPIAEVFLKGGAFNLKEFSPPLLQTKKSSELGVLISKLIINLRKNILNMKEQLTINHNDDKYVLLRNMNECLININTAFINEMHPFDIYLSLCESIGKISWSSILMPNIPTYEHNNSYNIIYKLVTLINEIITSNRGIYERIEFIKNDDCYEAHISEIGEDDILLIIEPNNIEVKQWIENTIISSKSLFNEFQLKRFPGIPRQIIDENNSEIIVKLDKFSNYLIINEPLVIYSGHNRNINSINLYYKKY